MLLSLKREKLCLQYILKLKSNSNKPSYSCVCSGFQNSLSISVPGFADRAVRIQSARGRQEKRVHRLMSSGHASMKCCRPSTDLAASTQTVRTKKPRLLMRRQRICGLVETLPTTRRSSRRRLKRSYSHWARLSDR